MTNATPRARGATVLPIVLLLSIAAALTVWVILTSNQRKEPDLPVLATVPEFQLQEASGKDVSLKDLSGKPWVADLIFTNCAGVCPRMSAEMARLIEQSKDYPEVRYVSISVDPERDTPEALEEYAKRYGADRSRWLFLRGDRGEIWDVAREGFLLPVEKGDPSQGEDDVIHSSRFVLVDGDGKVRGTYDIEDREAMLRLRSDLSLLASQTP